MASDNHDTPRDQDDVTNRRLKLLIGLIVVCAVPVVGWALIRLGWEATRLDLLLLAVFTALMTMARFQVVAVRVGAANLELSPASAGALVCVAFAVPAVVVIAAF